MIQTINTDLFESKITKKDTTNNKYEGGGYQLDIYTKGSKTDKRTAPIVRAFLDTEDEATRLAADVCSSAGGTKLKSTVKTNTKGKQVIQVKITKCSAKWQHYIALVAIPFRGSISGIIAGEDFDVIKGLIKNTDQFNHKVLGKNYNKILYLVLCCRTYGEAYNDDSLENKIKEQKTGTINICTVKSDVVSKDPKTGLATLRPMTYSIDINLDNNADIELSLINGVEQTDITEEELALLAPRVQFADLMDICKINAATY